MLYQMSKYFGKCFGPSTPAPESSFWLRCPSFLLSKFSSQLKLIQSAVRVRILGICFTSSNLRVLLSGFWDFALRILAICNSQIPISRVLGVRVSCPRVPVRGSWVSGSRIPGSQIPRVTAPRVSRSLVLGFRDSVSQVPGLRSWF